MTTLLSISQPHQTAQIFCGDYQQASDLIDHYESLYNKDSKEIPYLPVWALNAIFQHFANTKTLIESMGRRKEFLCQFMLTHRGAALDCFFDNIIATDLKTGQYLIYRPHYKIENSLK